MRSRARYFYGNMLRKIGPTKSFIRLGSYRSFDIYNRSLNRRENEKWNQRNVFWQWGNQNWIGKKWKMIQSSGMYSIIVEIWGNFSIREPFVWCPLMNRYLLRCKRESWELDARDLRSNFQLIEESANKVARQTFYDC